MNGIIPAHRPDTTRDAVLAFVTDGQPLPAFPFLVGRRGYAGTNAIGVYDDAIWLVEEDRIRSWNANCDPDTETPGMANLKCGRWLFEFGIHNISKPSPPHVRYPCLIQAANVTVERADRGDDTGMFGIHIHHGGENTTTSAGCQTIPPEQFSAASDPTPDHFMIAVHDAFTRYGVTRITYILTAAS